MSIISDLRNEYHQRVCREIIRVKGGKKGDFLNFADGDNKSSVEIAWSIAKEFGYVPNHSMLKEQTIGDIFEDATKDFLERAFLLLAHLRPGKWHYTTDKTSISGFVQYEHLAELDKKAKADKTSKLTPLRKRNQETLLLHASISCKWTLRSDRSQNARTEALNLIRDRKGRLPHIVAVVAEPLPTRIATLALGTGDLVSTHFFTNPKNLLRKDILCPQPLNPPNTSIFQTR